MSKDNQANDRMLAQGRAHLQAGRFAAAEQVAREVLAISPVQIDGLHLLAVSQRYAQDLDAALQTLVLLKQRDPTLGRAYQESGYCHWAQEQPAKALIAFQQAVQRNNSLLSSWQAISRLTSTSQHANWHRQANNQVIKLNALPPPLLSVRNMISEGKWLKAEQLCRQFLQRQPQHQNV